MQAETWGDAINRIVMLQEDHPDTKGTKGSQRGHEQKRRAKQQLMISQLA